MLKKKILITGKRLCFIVLFLSITGGKGVAQQPRGGPQGGPPSEALEACADKSDGDPCEFEAPHGTISGTCEMTPEQKFACKPEGGPSAGVPGKAGLQGQFSVGQPGAQSATQTPPPTRTVTPSFGFTETETRFSSLTMEDGLSNNHIESVIQDRRGFLWIGTQDGLNRYDGYEFIICKHEPDNPHSVSHSHIMDLLEDEQGMIWVATNGGGVNRFDPSTGIFTRYLSEAHNPKSLGRSFSRFLLVMWRKTFRSSATSSTTNANVSPRISLAVKRQNNSRNIHS